MTKQQFFDCCQRIGDLWPGGKRLPQATIDAWHEEFGSWADYDTLLSVIARMVKAEDKRPTLAKLTSDYRAVAGAKPKHGGQIAEEEEAARERPRYAVIGANWIRINKCMHDIGVRSMFRAMMEAEVEPHLIAESLVAEIDERQVQETEVKMIPRSNDLTPIGDVLRAGVA